MKKFLLFLAVFLTAAFNGFATDVTVTFADLGYANADDVTDVKTGDDVLSIVCAQATNKNNPPKYYTSGTGLRLYSGNTMTFKVADGYTIKSILFTASGSSYAVKGNVDGKAITVSSATSSWAGDQSEVVLSSTATCRMQKVEVTYESTGPKAVENVKIESVLNADETEATVTLSCATAGAQIYYGFAEDAMTTLYTAPFAVKETSTVYAYAQLGSDKSSTSKLSIEIPVIYTSLRELTLKATNGEDIVAKGNFEVIYQSGSNTIITDGESNTLIYDYNTKPAVGTKYSRIEGKVTYYNNLFEITAPVLTEGGNGATIAPRTVTDLSSISYDDQLFDLVEVKGATISGVNGKQGTLEANGTTIALYNNFNLSNYENGENFDVTAFVWRNNSNVQLDPISIEGGTVIETVETPEFDPMSEELALNEVIKITCATEGAEIRYTLDGTTPTEDSELYTEPIVFTEACTVKARAYKDGWTPSEVASMTYKVYDPAKPQPTSVSFDFNAENVDFGSDFTYPTTGFKTITEAVKDNITITFEGTNSNKPRIHYYSSKGCQLRVYKDDAIVFSVPDELCFTKIEFDTSGGSLTLAEGFSGTYSNKVWTAPEPAKVVSRAEADQPHTLKFNVASNVQINSINFTLDTPTGIENVTVADEAAEAVYYNLQGVRVANPERGLYIVVRGNSVTKELLR